MFRGVGIFYWLFWLVLFFGSEFLRIFVWVGGCVLFLVLYIVLVVCLRVVCIVECGSCVRVGNFRVFGFVSEVFV